MKVGAGIPSPKQQTDSENDKWYPYYAGYSTSFVRHVLEALTEARQSVLDPWNGAGTTTLVAAKLGRRATGFDINPAMATIARARLVPRSIETSLLPLGREIAKSASPRVNGLVTTPPDPLQAWFKRPAATVLRSYERRIAQLFEDPSHSSTLGMPSTVLSAFFVTALFSATRDLLSRFRSSNPTWLKYPTTPQRRIDPTPKTIESAFQKAVAFLSSRLPHMPLTNANLAEVSTGDALELDTDNTYDACLTSPPYFTRVDYVHATLAELAVLGCSKQEIASLRRVTTGTPVVQGTDRSDAECPSSSAVALTKAIKSHPSKGSAHYYAPWAQRYFAGLDESIRRICKVVTSGSPIGIVVQDSYYKDVHVDLQAIIVEMFEAGHRALAERVDFKPTHVRAWMHPSSSTHRPSAWTTTESLLVFS